MGFFEKIKAGLTRTKENIGHSFDQLFAGELNDDFYDELEETLILGDMGVDTTMKAVEELRRRVKAEKIKDMEGARTCLRRVLTDMLQVGEPALKLDTTPSVALFIGVNGVGKTTTISTRWPPPTPSGPPPPTSSRSGASAAAWSSSASTRGPIPRRWSLTPSPPPRPAAPTWCSSTPPGGCTTSRT